MEIRECYLNTENCYSKYTTKHPQNLKPQKQNSFEFNPRPQNTNQIKHLEQTKEINNKKKSKDAGTWGSEGQRELTIEKDERRKKERASEQAHKIK